MKKRIKSGILLSCLFLCALSARAQDNLLVLMQDKTGFTEDTWFSSGLGNELQTDKIKSNWDRDKYIVSAAHTSEGWFVAMAADCGYTGQTYSYGAEWPSEWLREKEGYYITTIACTREKWFIVLSAGTGFTGQAWKSGAWSEVADWIRERWKEDYILRRPSIRGTAGLSS